MSQPDLMIGETTVGPPRAPPPGVTVAVCTYRRTPQLARALASIARQAVPPDEVIVIDNAPADSATERLVRSFDGVRYVREPRLGLNFARNRALREASAEILLFLDDDAVAHEDWVRELRGTFQESPRVALCTGRVEPLTLETEGQRLFEANGGFGRGDRLIRLPSAAGRRLHGVPAPLIAWAVSVGSGNSYGVRRDVALRLGGFDEALDMGSVLPGGGDHDMLWRVLQAQYEVVYQPAALAWHEHRAEMRDTLDQIAGHQRALIAMLAKSVATTRGASRWGVLGFLGWRLVKPVVRLARRAAGRDPLPAAFLLHLWWHCWRGLAAYPRARRLANARRGVGGT